MKLSCNIIKDLLPLYSEGLASPESREAVEAHIAGCGACREELTAMGWQPPLAVEMDTAPLEHLGSRIRRRRILNVILAVLATACVLFGLFQYLYSPVYLSAAEAVSNVTEKGDIVIVELSPRAEYCRWQDSKDPETGRRSVTFIAARHRWNVLTERLFGAPAGYDDSRKMHLAANKDIWYASTGSGEEDTLLWGVEPTGGRISLPRLVLGYYFLMALGSGAVLLIPALVFRKKTAGRFFGVVCTLCFSFALSDLIATGGNWRIYDGYDVPILLTLTVIQTLLLSAAVLFGYHVWRANRE